MTDEKKPVAPVDPVPAPDVAPEKQTVAVHDDRLWGGPRHVIGLPGAPLVETKSEYRRLLNASGLRMHDQQESTTGPERAPAPTLTLDPIDVPPMEQEEAQLIGAMTAIYHHYALVETVWCTDCFTRDRPHGCRVLVTDRRVILECRCGIAAYEAPKGTTDLVLRRLPNLARTGADTIRGTVVTDAGVVERPTTVLHDMEALLIRRYFSAMKVRGKEPRIFHRGCFKGNPLNEENALAIGISPNKIVLVCACRTLYHQNRREVEEPARGKVM